MFSAMILRAGLRASVTKPSDLPLTKAEAGEYLKNLWTLLEEFAVTYGGRLLIALLILIVGFRIVNILTKRVLHSKVVNRLEPSARTFLQSMVGILCKVLIGIIALSVMGVPMTSIITVVGSCGLAVGLALQGSLANIAGGFVLLVVKPFKVGHYITVGDISGTVTEMGIFNTKLLTYDNRVVIIPNSAISNATVINLTELPLRRVDLTFTASYGDDTAAVKKALLDVCDGVVAPQRLLHGASRNVERFVEVCAKGHRDGNRDDERVEPLTAVDLPALRRLLVRGRRVWDLETLGNLAHVL